MSWLSQFDSVKKRLEDFLTFAPDIASIAGARKTSELLLDCITCGEKDFYFITRKASIVEQIIQKNGSEFLHFYLCIEEALR